MSQLGGVFKSGGGGGGGIQTLDGNVGFATGSTVTIKTTNEETLSFVGDDVHTLTLLTTDTNANLSLGTNAFILNNGTALHNVAIGPIALDTLLSGDGNTALGYNAGGNYVAAESNNIVIGAGVLGTAAESNAIHIGDDGTRTSCFIGGIDGVNVGSTAKVVTEGTGGTVNKLGTATITAGAGITVTPGANTITIAATGAGSFTWSVITVNQTAAVNNGYITNKAGTLALLLPAASAVGDMIRVTGINTATGWQITQGAGQQIFFGTASTTSGGGGSLTSSQIRDSIEMVCVVANLTWNVISSIGNITVV